MEERLMDIRELTEILKISKQTVYNRLSSGTFPINTYKVGRSLRWRLSEVMIYIESLDPVNLLHGYEKNKKGAA